MHIVKRQLLSTTWWRRRWGWQRSQSSHAPRDFGRNRMQGLNSKATDISPLIVANLTEAHGEVRDDGGWEIRGSFTRVGFRWRCYSSYDRGSAWQFHQRKKSVLCKRLMSRRWLRVCRLRCDTGAAVFTSCRAGKGVWQDKTGGYTYKRDKYSFSSTLALLLLPIYCCYLCLPPDSPWIPTFSLDIGLFILCWSRSTTCNAPLQKA